MAEYYGRNNAVPENGAFTSLYTVPTGKTAIVKGISATTFPQPAISPAVTVTIKSGGYSYPITTALVLSANTSVNTLLTPKNLAAGDEVIVSNTDSVAFTGVGQGAITNGGATPTLILGQGSTLIVYSAGYGLYRSTNDGASWVNVYNGTVASAPVSWAYIGTTFFIYLTTTLALKSTDDGVTWATQAVTNAPVYASVNSPMNRIVKNGSTYVGATTSTRLVSSTDGITWSNLGTTITTGTIAGIAWTGTNYVVASGAAAGVYYSTNGSSWTASSTAGASPSSIASDGSGNVIAKAFSTYYYSTDHGATFATVTGGVNSAAIFWIGSAFFAAQTTGTSCCVVKPASISTAATFVGHLMTVLTTYASDTKVYRVQNDSVMKSYNLDLTDCRYGVTFSIDYLEIS